MSIQSTISWEDAQMFLAVAEHGSFSAAALAFGVGQATVSRRVAQLEEQLGGVLFVRGRRGTDLTPLGHRMLPAAQQMSRWAAELQAAIASEEKSVCGKVTLASATGVASRFLVPFAAWFRQHRPELRLELRTGVEYLDLTRGEADIALRARRSSDPALVTLTEIKMTLHAHVSAAYLARFSTPPRTLQELDWICWDATHTHLFPYSLLEHHIQGFQPVFASDEYLLQLKACQAGLGAMMLAGTDHPLMEDYGLHRLDLEVEPMTGSLFLVCAKSMRFVPRVDAVIEALLEALDDLEVT